MKKIKQICIIALVILIMGVTTAVATTGRSTTDGLRLRSIPSTSGEVITTISNGEKVEIIEKSGEWYKVKFKEFEGYVHSDYIEADEEGTNTTSDPSANIEEPNEPEIEYPIDVDTLSNAKVYIIPSMTSTVIFHIESGETITITQKLNKWSYISYENKTGWVRNYVLENVVVNSEPEEEETPEEIPTVSNENSIRKGYVNVDEAIMRSEPSTSGSIVQGLTLNVEVTILAEEGDWYKIEYNGTTGYMAKRLISDKQTTTNRGSLEPRQTKAGYINVSVANVRQSASTNSAIVTTLNQRTKVDIVGEELDFYKIEINGGTGYIAKRLVSDSLEELATSTGSQTIATYSSAGTQSGQNIVEFAKQFLGYRYVAGGSTPSGGFDCSGFTQYVYSNFGYSIGRTCSAQSGNGISISKAELQLGDLLFFNNSSDGSIGHVGIYIGGGNFIHAANAKRGVVIDTINSGYYDTYYYLAKRVI